MFKKILLFIFLLTAVFLGYVALQPPEYLIFREVKINKAPEVIFPYINNSKKMNYWNPWSEMDPDAKMTFSGPEEGVGAKSSWTGGKKLGTGSATVSESIPNSLVQTKLDYTEPWEMHQLAQITLTPTENGTTVRWSVTGETPFIGRVFCFFMNMDKMVGGTFEKGLNNLKSTLEKN